MVSELILDFPDTRNVKTLRVTDASFYNPKVPVECALLSVTPPGYLTAIDFNVKEGFSIVLNSSNLKIAKVKVYKELTALPDGIYTFRYSINPNEKIWVEYDYLRIDKLMKDYYSVLCAAKLQPYPHSKEARQKLRELRELRTYMDAAKGEVEECGNRTRGMELYKYAQQLISEQCKTC